MLILTLTDVQYLHNVVFSFEKGLNGQNHYSSGFHNPIKHFPSLHPLIMLFGKP